MLEFQHGTPGGADRWLYDPKSPSGKVFEGLRQVSGQPVRWDAIYARVQGYVLQADEAAMSWALQLS